MAFADSQHILYDGTVRITYKDAAHRYFKQLLENGEWGKMISVRGVTTMMDAVLEKKGLMTWPMGLALRELFGFYNFTNEKGEQMTGFSKGVGTIWPLTGKINSDDLLDPENLLPFILSASKAWQRRKKSGADIGSIVHDAIEHFVLDQPFDILATYTASVMAADYESEADQEAAIKNIEGDIKQAQLAFNQFVAWWKREKPELLGAEQLVYSREMDVCGTYDILYRLNGKRVLADYKTSNASSSKEAAAPQGIYYSYFIQSGLYAAALAEMGQGKVDDLAIISCRKDGGFTIIYASELGLSVDDCIEWGRAVWKCYELATKTKSGLLNNVNVKETT